MSTEQLRTAFERQARDAFGFRRSRKGTYVNPAVARDWKWFQAGAFAAMEAASQPGQQGATQVTQLIPRADGTYVLEHNGAPVDYPIPPAVYGFAPTTAVDGVNAAWTLRAKMPDGGAARVTLEYAGIELAPDGVGIQPSISLLVEPEGNEAAWISWEIDGPGLRPRDIDRSSLPIVMEGPSRKEQADRIKRLIQAYRAAAVAASSYWRDGKALLKMDEALAELHEAVDNLAETKA